MKTIIVSINSKYIHSSLAPWALLAGVKVYAKNEHNCSVAEFTINMPLQAVINSIIEKSPDVLGLSCYIWNIKFIEQILAPLKQALPNAVFILGGPEVSYNAKDCFTKYSEVDFIIAGEGELPFALLLDSILENTYIDIQGLCQRNNGNYIIQKPYINQYDPPNPYCDEYFNTLNNRIAYIEASRGCPYSCAFCLSGRADRLRNFNLQDIKANIIKLASSGTKTIKFVDRTFNANKKRCIEILEFIKTCKDIPTGVCFHFEIAGDILDSETIELMNAMPQGLIQLEIGMQSFNEHTLSAINRKTNCDKLIENIKRLNSVKNKHIHIDLIAGLPYEDMQSFKNSFNLGFSLDTDMLQLGFLKLLHGSAMRENKRKYPLLFNKVAPYEVISTPYLSETDISKLKGVEDSLEKIYNSGRFKQSFNYALEASALSAFELFDKIALQTYPCPNISLYDYCDKLYYALLNIVGIDKAVLRDIMLIDWLSKQKTTKLPACLYIADSGIKAIRAMLEQDKSTARPNTWVRNIGILYTMKKAIYADYEHNQQLPIIKYINYFNGNMLNQN